VRDPEATAIVSGHRGEKRLTPHNFAPMYAPPFGWKNCDLLTPDRLGVVRGAGERVVIQSQADGAAVTAGPPAAQAVSVS